jgi:bacterioferritin
MRGDPRIVDYLNELLTLELTVINQYFVHAKMCESWGYRRLAERFRKDALDEMRDAESLIERILFLEGVPNVQRIGTVALGETVAEQLRLARDAERNALELLARGIALADEVGDRATREFLAPKLADEEAHLGWVETQLSLIEQVGEQGYLAQQIRE